MTQSYATTPALIEAIEKTGAATIAKREHIEALFVVQSEMSEAEITQNETITNLLLRKEGDSRWKVLELLRRVGETHGESKLGNGVNWAEGITSDVTLEITGARAVLSEVRRNPEMFKSMASYDLRNSSEFVQGLRYLFEIDTPNPDSNVRARHQRSARVSSAA